MPQNLQEHFAIHIRLSRIPQISCIMVSHSRDCTEIIPENSPHEALFVRFLIIFQRGLVKVIMLRTAGYKHQHDVCRVGALIELTFLWQLH